MSRQIKDLTGQRFGSLTALEPLPERKFGQMVWRCRCDCGETVDVARSSLSSGHTRSCGCLRRMLPESVRGPRVRQECQQRRTPYPVNEKCASYNPDRGRCAALTELLCATRGKCSFFKGDAP